MKPDFVVAEVEADYLAAAVVNNLNY